MKLLLIFHLILFTKGGFSGFAQHYLIIWSLVKRVTIVLQHINSKVKLMFLISLSYIDIVVWFFTTSKNTDIDTRN